MRAFAGLVATTLVVHPLHGQAKLPSSDKARHSVSCELPTSTPSAEGASARGVQQLLDTARATRSDAFLVMKNGKVIAEWYSGRGAPRPIQTMSATKSVVGLAIMRLLQEQKLDSLDQPVWTIYPEWRQGQKRLITIRHLLNHTSGLQDVPGDGAEIEPAPDAIQLALAAELMAAPGTSWFYSNKATNLLAGIVQRASGKPLDRYVQDALLEPLCIADAHWAFRDSAGNPYGMAGLALHARDLAKIGQLMLNGGMWNGVRILSPELVRSSLSTSQPFEPRYGLLWWIEPAWSESTIDSTLVSAWNAAAMDTSIVRRLSPLTGRRFAGADWAAVLDSVFAAPAGSHRGMRTLSAAARAAGVPMRRIVAGPARGYYANGSLGQWLFIVPSEQLVVVRQKARSPGHRSADNFHDLPSLTLRLLASPPK